MTLQIHAARAHSALRFRTGFFGFLWVFGLLWAASGVAGCARSHEAPGAGRVEAPSGAGAPAAAADGAAPAKAGSATRKVVRQAELELEVATPSSAESAIERLAELHGGYVVSAARDTDHDTSVDVRVNLVVRVPEAELTQTITAVKKLGRGTGSERITSDDVTDEYIDLTARLSSQQKLEQQYFEILKRATTVKDAIDVQKELADVRAEIERLQGRQRLLDKESAYSTLTVQLTTAVPRIAVSSTTIGGALRRTWADAVSESADIVYGVIHVVGFLAPIALLLGVPSGVGIWLLLRVARGFATRARRTRAATVGTAT